MTRRIVLSLLLLLPLAGSTLAHADEDADAAPSAATALDAGDDNGIGTSPSIGDEPLMCFPAPVEWRAPAEWRAATLQRSLPTPLHAGLDWFSLVVLLAPIIQTVIGKIFASQVKDSNRRTEILGYADTAFQVVEAVGPQLGLSGKDKYLRFIEQVVNSLKAAGKPEPTAQEMQLLKQLATDKAYLAKALPLPRAIAFPLPPPPPRAG